MRGRRGRAPRRLCLGAAGVCALAALAAPSHAQEDGVGVAPEVFRGSASALVASVEADRAALLPVPEVFRFIALDTTSTYETDLQTARASLLFPGNGLMLGPNLVCGTFAGGAPPEFEPLIDACLQYEYPLSVRADASNPSASTEGAITLGAPTDPISGDAVSARAHADPDGASSYAAMQELRVLGLPALGPIELLPLEELQLDTSILTIEDATSRTDQAIVGGVLTAHAESVLTGVRLVGGLIEIGSIRSVSHVTDDAAGVRTAESSLEVSGVTVGGVPAQITDQGLVVGSPSGGSGPIQQQLQTALNELVEALGVRITVLEAEQTLDDGGQAVASVGGLLVEVATDVQGLPILPGPVGDIDLNGTYVGTIQLGNSAAAAGAVNFDDFVPSVDVPDFDSGGFVADGAGTIDLGALPNPAPAANETAPGSPPAGGPSELVRIFDTFGGRMGLLYLAFAFAVLGLCVMPKLTVPPRLPGPPS